MILVLDLQNLFLDTFTTEKTFSLTSWTTLYFKINNFVFTLNLEAINHC